MTGLGCLVVDAAAVPDLFASRDLRGDAPPTSPALRERAALRARASAYLQPRAARDFAAEIAEVEASCRARGDEGQIPVAVAALHEAWGDHVLPTDPSAAAERTSARCTATGCTRPGRRAAARERPGCSS